MSENDLQAAGTLITQAEALGVQYSPLHLGDTPSKLRREFDRLAQSRQPSGSGQLFGSVLGPKTQPSPVDPFSAARQNGQLQTQNASTSKVTPLPPTDSPFQAPTSAQTSQFGLSSDNNPAGKATSMAAGQILLDARRALAVGDVRRAEGLLQRVRSMNVPYGPQDDNPDKVDLQVRAYSDLMSQREQRGNTEAYRRQYARLLMEQADGLLRWRELDEAERLASLAAQQHVMYNPYEPKPQDLLQRIATARRQARPAGMPTAENNAAAMMAAKQQVTQLLQAARAALRANDLPQAERLARQAQALQVPEPAFAPGEDRPGLLLMEIERVQRSGDAVVAAGAQFAAPATGQPTDDRRADRALYDQQRDPTRNILATAQQPFQQAVYGPNASTPPAQQANSAMALFEKGEAALRDRKTDVALDYFRQAAANIHELDPMTAQRLQDRLQMLARPVTSHATGSSPLNEAAAKQQVLARQIAGEVSSLESRAHQVMEKDPKAALAMLEEARKKVETASLDSPIREQLLRRVERSLGEVQKFVDDNRARIELEEKNRAVTEGVQQSKQHTLEIQEKLAQMVDEYNTLMREQRFEEAEVLAKRAAELDPKNPLTIQLVTESKLIRQYMASLNIQSDKEEKFVMAMTSVDKSSIPFDDMIPIVFPEKWGDLTKSRREIARRNGPRRSERELEIQQKLQTPVSLQFKDTPLSTVLETLEKVAAVNMHIDPRGLSEEGVSTDTPVTINLREEIKLASALNLILQPLHLGYVIRDDVLKITSEQMRGGDVYPVTYQVADLVIPIPNFSLSPRMGLAGAYHDAVANANMGIGTGFSSGGTTPLPVLTATNSNSQLNPAVMAQMSANTPKGMSANLPLGFGPGGLGGAGGADFDSLIDLITSTVAPTTWDTVGGPGSIMPFETNLSLVISQTQEVHDEIADLLDQLRRLQDLQVTIEVRFITLNDNFFERIGVDFDFDVTNNIPISIFGSEGNVPGVNNGTNNTTDNTNTNTTSTINPDNIQRSTNETITVGLSAPNVFTADLDIPFRQGSFDLAIPQFGPYNPTAGASLGFAILSDIEAFFFIEAATGDTRSNVMQAPKVTLFNGQTATVSDTSQTPFVISVIPVVGDFAAAQQPVVVVLSEGTFLSVQAVISADRRFVRLTLVPFFSQIGQVNTFTFTGSQTTTQNTSQEGVQDPATDATKKSSSSSSSSTGTTVQLPSFSYVSVTTTVSVPDGGTVLLGGVKRLSEGRNEYGVPILSQIPYVNRLFRNVGIGRNTQSLMMMVTPRIIIQEEEEEKLGILPE